MKIGITERGDASIDYRWVSKVPNMDLTILITKNITMEFITNVINLHNQGHRLIVHCTCTGWGGTFVEPHVPVPEVQLDSLYSLIVFGFPREQCVLRIDPIIPDIFQRSTGYQIFDGFKNFNKVIELAREMALLPNLRVRISVVDSYRHVDDRFKEISMKLIQDNEFTVSPYGMRSIGERLYKEYPDITFETCAEPYLNSPNIESIGCVSSKDLDIFSIDYTSPMELNPQNRHGCKCLYEKTELLSNRSQCTNKCLYCYWKGSANK